MTLPNIPPHLLEYKLNPKAFINAHNFPNLESLLQEVIRIDLILLVIMKRDSLISLILFLVKNHRKLLGEGRGR